MTGFALDDAAWTNRWRARSVAEKAVLSGGLLLVAVSATAPVVPIGIGLFALLAAVTWARVPWRTFVAAWTGPLIFTLIGLVGVVVSVGAVPHPVLTAGPLAVDERSVSSAVLIGSRAFGCSAAVLLLASTTPIVDVFESLRRLRVPEVMLDLAGAMYRLIFVLGATLTRTREAQAARLGYARGACARRSVAALFVRTLVHGWDRAARLERGLAGRGYSGSLRMLAPERPVSWPFVGSSVAVVAVAAAASVVLR